MVQQPVEYQHAGGRGQGMLMDLALQGCRIAVASRLSCGMFLKLLICFRDQAEFVTIERAVVRLAIDDQFGVSFLEMSSGARASLAVCMLQCWQGVERAAAPLLSSGPRAQDTQ
jgi:hypothetical protein